MSVEFPSAPMLPKDTPLQKTENEVGKEIIPAELSFEGLATLQKEIELLEGKLAFARGRKSDVIRAKTLDEVRRVFVQYPKCIQQGLQYEETTLITLQLISTAWDVTRKREESQINHFSERGLTDDELLAEVIESQVIDSEQSIQKILRDEKNTERKTTFKVISNLLDSPIEHHREYGELMLMENLPTLAKLFLDQIRISRNDEVVHVWQEMFLRVKDPKHLRYVASMFEAVWDKRREIEEKDQKKKQEAGEEIYEGREWNDLYNNFFRKILSTSHEAFTQNKDFALKTAVRITGLNGDKTMNEWMCAGGPDKGEGLDYGHQYAYSYNLKSLYELKQSSSEAPQVLNTQFGITHFGRYTREMLLKQYKERDEKKPYGIVLFPVADHNGAFFGSAIHLDQLQEALGKEDYKIRIIEAGSQEAIARRLISLDRRYGQGNEKQKISFSLIGGHGAKDHITFGEGQYRREQMTKEDVTSKSMIRGAEKFFDPGAETILFSCSTGAEEGIAEEMFKQLGFLMQAPKNDAHVSNIFVSFDEKHKPTFKVEYTDSNGNTIPTMSYRPLEKTVN